MSAEHAVRGLYLLTPDIADTDAHTENKT